MKENIIGREREIKELNNMYNSGKAELVALYGRRRVGKTFLVDEVLEGKITFRHAGLSPIEREQEDNKNENVKVCKSQMKLQLKHFYMSLMRHGMKKSHCPTSWLEAFYMLESLIEKLPMQKNGRQVLFLDELPWMDTPRSGFVTAFEAFWNTWGCHRRNLMVIVCGSATSWILDNFIDNHGGLYGRVTKEIKIRPFCLEECELFYKNRDVRLSRYDIVQSYMVMGGIPYYMNYVERGMSINQVVSELFFGEEARLKGEYDRLFASVFSKPEAMKLIVETLATRHAGWSRQQLIEKTGMDDNGTFSSMLKSLTASDFIIKYSPFGHAKNEDYYKLTDSFCWFWLHFVKGCKKLATDFWQGEATGAVRSWRGIAFEEVCWYHWRQIKRSLGINGVQAELSAWSKHGDEESEGTQIDLLIERNDHIINMCEMKFYNDEFTVDKTYHKKLINRQNMLERQLPKNSVVHPTLITTEGLKYNEYSGIFQKVVTLDDLFRREE